jgi:transcriptional regulator with XRE-family HTH domain
MKLNPEALRVIRERTGLSKAELADRAGIDRTLVTRLENGERSGTPAVIVKLAAALQVLTARDLLGHRRGGVVMKPLDR